MKEMIRLSKSPRTKEIYDSYITNEKILSPKSAVKSKKVLSPKGNPKSKKALSPKGNSKNTIKIKKKATAKRPAASSKDKKVTIDSEPEESNHFGVE